MTWIYSALPRGPIRQYYVKPSEVGHTVALVEPQLVSIAKKLLSSNLYILY